MKLTDLDPQWLTMNGKRVGFTFLSPNGKQGPIHWRQSCFAIAVPMRAQMRLFGEDNVQPCKQTFAWSIEGGIDAADFATITVKPSLDGSDGGLWHGYITNGLIS